MNIFNNIKKKESIKKILHKRYIRLGLEIFGAILIVGIVVGVYLYFNSTKAEAAWFDDNWHYRKKLTIDHTKVSGGANLSNFPALVSLTDTNLKSQAQGNGADIMFTDSDGTTKLDHEIESYASTSGTLTAWVRIPTLHYQTDDTFYLYYGNSSTTTQENKTGVWSDGGSNYYKGVYHLKETPTGSTGDIIDSTATNNATSYGSMGSSNQVAGKVNGSLSFNGTSNYVDADDSSSLSITGDLTLSGWIKPNATTASTQYNITGKWDGDNRSYLLTQYGDEIRVYIDSASNYVTTNAANLVAGNWYHVEATYTAAAGTVTIYVNGVSQAATTTGTIPTSIGDDGGKFFIGAAPSSTQTLTLQPNPTAGIDTVIATGGDGRDTWNFGVRVSLVIGELNSGVLGPYVYHTLIKFDLSSIPSNAVITSAQLELYQSTDYSDNARTFRVFRQKRAWIEGTRDAVVDSPATGATQHRYDTTNNWQTDGGFGADDSEQTDIGSLAMSASEAVGWKTFALTPTTKAGLDLGNGWMLKADTETNDAYAYYSSDYTTDTAKRPKLVVNYTDANYYNGLIDESRISNTARSAGWITTEYNNQNNPESFFSKGPEERSKDPILYLKFDDGQGTTAYDSSPNKTNGTLTGTTTPSWQTEDMCVSGKCLSFPGGTSGSVTVSNTVSSVKSVSFWVKSATASASMVEFDNSTHYISSDSNGTVTATGFSSPTIYVNGKSSSTPTITANTWNHIEVTTDTSFDATAIKIGRYKGNYLKGYIDEFKIYDYARSAAQVKADYASRGSVKGASVVIASDAKQSLSNGLVGYWKMNETSGTAVADASGNGNTGTLTNAQETNTTMTGSTATTVSDTNNANLSTTDNVYNNMILYLSGASCNVNRQQRTISSYNGSTKTFTVSVAFTAGPDTANCTYTVLHQAGGKFGNGIQFDGVNDNVVTTSGLPSNTTSISIAVWFKPDHIIADGDKLVAVTNNSCGDPGQFGLSTGAFWVKYQSCAHRSITYTPNLSSYNLVVVTAVLQKMTLYLNGVQVGTRSDLSGFTSFSTNAYNIGKQPDNGAGYFYKGGLDEVRIYNRALSPKEVRDLYNFAPRPVAYLKLDDKVAGDSKTLADSSGYGYNGTTYSANGTGMDCTQQGKYGGACQFDGVDDYVRLSLSLFGYSQITYTAWVKINGPPVTTKYSIITGSEGRSGIYINTDGKAEARAYDINDHLATSTTTVTDNKWHYLVATYQEDITKTRIYVDGRLENEISYYPVILSSLSYPYSYIGESPNTVTDRYLLGQVDDVKIYNYARTPSQILADMGTGQAQNQPVGYWKFDEGFGTTAHDSSPNKIDASLATAPNNPTWTLNGKYGKALVFNGVNNYVNVGTNPVFDFSGTQPFSITAWIKSTNLADGYVVSKYNSNVSGQFILGLSGSKIVLHREVSPYQITSTTSLQANQWYHVAGVYDGTNMYIYLNGVSNATPIASGSIASNSEPVYIGAGRTSSSPDHFFNGIIDEPKVYNFALTSDEILTDYNRGSSLILGSFSDTSGLTGGSVASTSASAQYCVPGDTTSCTAPVGEWNFEEGTGGTVNDTSGNGNTGTWYGTGTNHWTAGKVGKAGQFNGLDDYVAGSGAIVTQLPITVEAWVKLNTPTSWYWEIAGQGNGLYLSTNPWNHDFSVLAGSCSELESTTIPVQGQWYHLAGTWNGTVERIFVNGTLEKEANCSTSFSSSAWWIGHYNWYAPIAVDNVRIFNYARTPAQIAWDYNRGGPVAYWKMDECQGNIAHDSSGNSLTGTWSGSGGSQTSVGTCTDGLSTSAWYNGRTGKYNSSLNFDGGAASADDVVTVTQNSIINLTSKTGYALSAWVYANSDGEGDNGNVFSKGAGTYLKVSGQSGSNLNIDVSLDLATTDATKSLTAPITTGTWNHIVMVYDSSTAQITLYVNGQSKGSSTNGVGATATDSNNLLIGNNSAGSNTFDGQIDDVQIYNYGLTAAQVKNIYNQNSGIRFGPTTGSP